MGEYYDRENYPPWRGGAKRRGGENAKTPLTT